MITDADIQKLKAVFATKDDLKKFATKDDLEKMAEKIENKIVADVAEVIQDGVIKILDEHEKRIDRLEKHIGGFPSIA